MILFITHKYPPCTGGMERHSYELHIELESRGYDVYLHAYTGEGSKMKWLIKLYFEVPRILRRHPEISIIYFNDMCMAALNTWVFKLGLPVVATAHGLDVSFPFSIYQKRIRKAFKKLNNVVCVSYSTRNVCIEKGLDPMKARIAFNGVHTEWTETDSRRRLSYSNASKASKLKNKSLILMVGRPVRRKGFSWFLTHVFPALPDNIHVLLISPKRKIPKIERKLRRLLNPYWTNALNLMTGHADDESAVNRLVREGTNRDRIHRIQNASDQDLKFWFKQASILIMPNISVQGDKEGFGLVALEAILGGCKVLAADIDGIPSAVRHEKNGWLVPSGDVKSWQQQIMHTILLPTPPSHKHYTLDHYSWSLMTQRYIDIFQKILDDQEEVHLGLRPPELNPLDPEF